MVGEWPTLYRDAMQICHTRPVRSPHRLLDAVDTTPPEDGDHMVIDCDACVMQHTSACGDCIVTVLLDTAPQPTLELGIEEREALEHLADAGMVAPLRLVPRLDRRDDAATG